MHGHIFNYNYITQNMKEWNEKQLTFLNDQHNIECTCYHEETDTLMNLK